MAGVVLTTRRIQAQPLGDDLQLQLASGSVTLEVGTRGPAGKDAAAVELPATAAEDISGHVAVGFLADGRAARALPSGGIEPAGVIHQAVMSGATVQVVCSGRIDEPTWSWTPGPVYVAADGSLTQVPPAAGEVYVAGEAVGPTRLFVSVRHVAALAP